MPATAIVDDVDVLLTERAMREMNKAVLTDKKEPADVAKAFLTANELT